MAPPRSIERLRFEGVAKSFGAVRAVDDVTLAVEEGEFLAILGASGCGKTTLLRIAAGFTAPDRGRVVLDGEEVTERAPSVRGMGFVFQSYALFPTKTVAQNIGFALAVAGAGRQRIEARVREVAALVALDALLDRYPHELSGGQQQRVALARAIAAEPRVLLLDEPLAALDSRIRLRLRDEVRALAERLRITALYVTHDQEEALAIADRVVVMREGRIEQEGSPADIYFRPATRFVAEFVGTGTLLEGRIEQGRPLAEGIVWPMGERTLEDGPCLLVVRPEDLRPASGEWALVGVVERARFLGAIVRVTLRLPSGRQLLVDLPGRSGTPRVGERLALAPAAAPAILRP